MKKTISLFLCLIITFSFVSCTAAEPEIVPEYDSSIPEDGLDLNGAVIIVGGENGYEEGIIDSTGKVIRELSDCTVYEKGNAICIATYVEDQG